MHMSIVSGGHGAFAGSFSMWALDRKWTRRGWFWPLTVQFEKAIIDGLQLRLNMAKKGALLRVSMPACLHQLPAFVIKVSNILRSNTCNKKRQKYILNGKWPLNKNNASSNLSTMTLNLKLVQDLGELVIHQEFSFLVSLTSIVAFEVIHNCWHPQ
jgi:hypothetical protein